MRQIVRYRFMTIPNKLYADVRITVDDNSRAETKGTFEGGKSTTLVLLPMINIQILKPIETSNNGTKFRPKGGVNDSIGLTKFNFPTFINELRAIWEDMKTENLYVYRGDRLDLNSAVADKIRRAFIVGRTSIELKAVVLEQLSPDGRVERLEGIKMKFNNEDSSVLLTLREIESMIWVMDHVDIDNLVLTMYTNFIERTVYQRYNPVVDIQPVSRPVYSQAKPTAYMAVEVPASMPTVEMPTVDEDVDITPEPHTPAKKKEFNRRLNSDVSGSDQKEFNRRLNSDVERSEKGKKSSPPVQETVIDTPVKIPDFDKLMNPPETT